MRKIILNLLILLIISGCGALGKSRREIVQWDLPTHTRLESNCSEEGLRLSFHQPLEVTIQWRVKGTNSWKEAEAGSNATNFTLQNLSPVKEYEVRVGTHYPNEPVFCWSEIIKINKAK